MKRITILGNNSGRNAGDMAILGNQLRDISELYDGLEFLVTTTNPRYIKDHFGGFNVKPISMQPWYGCVKNLGWPLYRAMTHTDLILICDNILFDRKYYNPLFNNLASIALFAPAAYKRGIPIVLYNVSVGPIDFPYGKRALQKVLKLTDLVVTRDEATRELFDQLQLSYPQLLVHADCALNTEPPSDAEMAKIIQQEGLFANPRGTIGLNVNAYIDDWSKRGTYTRADFCTDVAGAADKVVDDLGVDIVFFVTQIMDIPITNETVAKVRRRDRVKVITNERYNYEIITGLIRRVALHAGLRTHPLIFAAAMHTPMIGLTSYPKSTGFLRTIGMEEWQVSLDELSRDRLAQKIKELWEVREEVAAKLAPRAEAEKLKARSTAELLAKYLD